MRTIPVIVVTLLVATLCMTAAISGYHVHQQTISRKQASEVQKLNSQIDGLNQELANAQTQKQQLCVFASGAASQLAKAKINMIAPVSCE